MMSGLDFREDVVMAMDTCTREDAMLFLQSLVNQPLCYGVKSPDTELYEFGFGSLVETVGLRGEKKCCTYILHIMCRFKIIYKKEKRPTTQYYEDTPCEKFLSEFQHLIGLNVKRIALSDKNDLWLDLGDYWIVFATCENGEESWRYFTKNQEIPHLIAADSWLAFV